MPFAKSWKRHETAATYQATRHHLDNLSYQPPAAEVAARCAERFLSGRTESLPIREEGRRSPRGERERRTPPHLRALLRIYLTATTVSVSAFVTGVRNPKALKSGCPVAMRIPSTTSRRDTRPRPHLRVLRHQGHRTPARTNRRRASG